MYHVHQLWLTFSTKGLNFTLIQIIKVSFIQCSKVKTKKEINYFPRKKYGSYVAKVHGIKVTELCKAMKANKYKNVELQEMCYHMGMQTTV